METEIRAHALKRLLLAKDDLVVQMRGAIPASWPQQVHEFVTTVRSVEGVPLAAALTVFIEISQELERFARIPTGFAPRKSFVPFNEPVPANLSTAMLCECFEEWLRGWFTQIRPGRLVPSVQTHRVTKYIDDHFTEWITLERLRAVSGWDGRLLARMFKAEMGLTIRAYVERKRLDAAVRQLRQGDKVESVVANVGWRGRKNFFRAFRKQVGVTPAQYRALSMGSTGIDGQLSGFSGAAGR